MTVLTSDHQGTRKTLCSKNLRPVPGKQEKEMTSPVQSPLQDPSVLEYRFGVFTVNVRSGELRKHGIRIKLQERPFQLLIALVENQGEIVTREELRQRLWPEGIFVDFDHNITSTINKLRSA